MRQTNRRQPKQDFFWLLLMTLPVVTYLLYGLKYSGTIFYGDDFDLLETITLSPEATTLSEKLRFWVKQQNEHRIIFPRLITLVCYTIEGFINWKTVILVANCIWIAAMYFLWRAFRSLDLPVWLFLPIPFLLLQPQYYENLTWAISILQQSNVLFWLSLTFFLYARGQYKIMLIPAFISIFTHGNGLSIIPIITLFICIEKRWNLLKYWGPFAVVTLVGYFFHFEKGQSSGFSQSLSNPVQLFKAFFAFLGGVTRVLWTNPEVAVAAGLIMVIVFVIYAFPPVVRTINSKNLKLNFFDTIVLGISTVLIVSAVLVSVSRSWGGLENVLPPRYLHNTALFACLTYLIILSILKTRRLYGIMKVFGYIAAFSGILFNLLSYFVNHPFVAHHLDTLAAEETNYLNHGMFPQYHWTFNRNIKTPYTKAINKGVIKTDQKLPDVDPDNAPVDSSASLNFSVTFKKVSHEVSDRKEGILWIQGTDDSEDHFFLHLQPDAGTGTWVAVRRSRPAFMDMLLHGALTGHNLHATTRYENLPLGNYQIGVLKNKNQYFQTNQRITITNEALQPL